MSHKSESLTDFFKRPYRAFLFGEEHGGGEEQEQRYVKIIRAATRAKIPHANVEVPPDQQEHLDAITQRFRTRRMLLDEKPSHMEKRLLESQTSWSELVTGLAEIYATKHHVMKVHAIDIAPRPPHLSLISQIGMNLQKQSLPLTLPAMMLHIEFLSDNKLEDYRRLQKRPDLTKERMIEDLREAYTDPQLMKNESKIRNSEDSAIADLIIEKAQGNRSITFAGDMHFLHYKSGSNELLDIDEALRQKLGNDKVVRVQINGAISEEYPKKPEFFLGNDFRIHLYVENPPAPIARRRSRTNDIQPK